MKAGIGTMLHYLSGADAPIEWMEGRVLEKVEGLNQFSEKVVFTFDDGSEFFMWHQEDCCESVNVADFEVGDGFGGIVISAKVVTNEDSGQKPSEFYGPDTYYDDSWTWTFIEIRTEGGLLTMRWLGESNGYYGETPCFSATEVAADG